MKTLKVKNVDLNIIGKALNYPMKFQQGRVKNRFISLLAEKAQIMEKNRKEILEGLCDKDDKGVPVVENGQYKFSAENQAKVGEEYNKLIQEEVLIDILPSLEVDIPTIKQMINNSPVELEAFEVDTVERLITALSETAPKPEKKSKKS